MKPSEYNADASHNRVVLITGAAKRLGAHTARFLHQRGYRVVIHYHQSKTEAEALCNQLNEQRANSAVALSCNLIEDDLKKLVDNAYNAWGQLDALINNASSFYPTALDEVNEDHWQALMGSNMKAPLFLCQHAEAYLKQNYGCIINMIDIHHKHAMPNHVIYNAAKAALASLTRSLALDCAPHIRVNGVSPGAILWPEFSDSKHEEKVLSQIPMRSIGQPEDIAQAIYFLMNAPYITGHIINVDGGRSISI